MTLKILLVEPPMPNYGGMPPPRYPPLALCVLAAASTRFGPVDLFDCASRQLGVKQAAAQAVSGRYDIVGLRSVFITYPGAVELAEELSRLGYRGTVVFGGPHLSLITSECLDDCPSVDACSYGEGEITFPLLLELVRGGGLGPAGRSEDAAGPRIIGRQGVLVQAPFLDSLDDSPLPAWNLLDSEYQRRAGFATVEGARGCDEACIFCALPRTQGGRIRRKSVERVITELKALSALGLQRIEFLEPHFTRDRNWAAAVCSEVARAGLKLELVIRTYPEYVDPGILRHMAESGVVKIFYGIESGSQRLLDAYGRGADAGRSADAIRWTESVGIKAFVNIILGGPGEDVDSINESVRFIQDTNPSFADVSLIAPFPGTPLYDEPGRFGITLTDPHWYTDPKAVSSFPWVSALSTDDLSAQELMRLWLYAATRITRRERQ